MLTVRQTLTDRQTDRQRDADSQTDTDRQTNRQRDADSQTDTDRQIDRQTDRQRDADSQTRVIDNKQNYHNMIKYCKHFESFCFVL